MRSPLSRSAESNGKTPTNTRARKARPVGKLGALFIRKPAAILSELAFLIQSFSVIRPFDILVISGGGQLLDSWGGAWDFPYTILKWVSLAKLTGTKCYFVNVGAGPLRFSLSRFFVRQALRLADYVSFRDEKSKALVKELGWDGRSDVYPDCVYGLDVPPTNPIRSGNEPIVGLSPMAYCDPRRYWMRDQSVYDGFTHKIALFGSWLSNNYRVTLFSTDIWFDAATLEEVGAAMLRDTDTNDTRLLEHEPINVLETLLSQMSSMDFILTCRFHGVVFAHLMNVPVIALSHHPKVSTLMADMGLSEYCLDIDTFDLELLKTTFTRLAANKEDIKSRMAEKAGFYRSELNRQFDQLFPRELVS
jgi:polysaccharide pyruvyl transferase WcaK-like protein